MTCPLAGRLRGPGCAAFPRRTPPSTPAPYCIKGTAAWRPCCLAPLPWRQLRPSLRACSVHGRPSRAALYSSSSSDCRSSLPSATSGCSGGEEKGGMGPGGMGPGGMGPVHLRCRPHAAAAACSACSPLQLPQGGGGRRLAAGGHIYRGRLTASSGSSLWASPFSLLLALMSRLRGKEGRGAGGGVACCQPELGSLAAS